MFSDFSALIAEITRILTVDSSGRIITAIQPVVAIGFTLSLIMMGTLSTFQIINNPLGEVLRKFFKWGIIVSIALSTANLQSYIVDNIISFPDDIAKLFVTESTDYNSVLDAMLEKCWTLAESAFSKAGFVFGDSAFYAYGFLVIMGGSVLVGIGSVFIFSAQIILALLCALAPIFIILLAFDVTKDYFSRWVQQVVVYILVIVLVSVVFSFFIAMMVKLFDSISFDAKDFDFFKSLGSLLLMYVMGIGTLFLIPKLANGLSGSISAMNVGTGNTPSRGGRRK